MPVYASFCLLGISLCSWRHRRCGSCAVVEVMLCYADCGVYRAMCCRHINRTPKCSLNLNTPTQSNIHRIATQTKHVQTKHASATQVQIQPKLDRQMPPWSRQVLMQRRFGSYTYPIPGGLLVSTHKRLPN